MPSVKVSLLMSRLFKVVITSERGPFRFMRLMTCSTVDLSRPSSSRLTLVCSGVTLSA